MVLLFLAPSGCACCCEKGFAFPETVQARRAVPLPVNCRLQLTQRGVSAVVAGVGDEFAGVFDMGFGLGGIFLFPHRFTHGFGIHQKAVRKPVEKAIHKNLPARTPKPFVTPRRINSFYACPSSGHGP